MAPMVLSWVMGQQLKKYKWFLEIVLL
jgi:hypothetical protein